jgi:hypothetical protein
MDAWTENTTIWLRDLLRDTDYFKSSRIMTFGYDSDLRDKSSTMELADWAQTLLYAVNSSRSGSVGPPRFIHW